MSWLIPFPTVSAALFALWLILNQSISPGHVLLGLVAGLAGGWSLSALEPLRTRPRRLPAVLKLLALVLADILRSNIAVARIILFGAGRTDRVSGFVEIPLDLRNRYGLATLACIITATPGTLWVHHNARGVLTIHVLDVVDEAEWIRTIKGRYERLLLEIFE